MTAHAPTPCCASIVDRRAWPDNRCGRGERRDSIPHDFRQPGASELRVFISGDGRNTSAQSDATTVVSEQTENPTFTINATAPTTIVGLPITISGILDAPGSTVPLPATSATLWGRPDGGIYTPLASTLTGADSSYGFTQMPSHSDVYQVRTTSAPPPRRLTAQLFEGVSDAVTISASSTSSQVGKTVTFTGTVTPDKAFHAVYLERLGADGAYHIVSTGFVNGGSAYKLKWTFGSPGTRTFRVLVPGGVANVSGASPAVAVAVALPTVESLPPAS
jgi:hypothetical protein